MESDWYKGREGKAQHLVYLDHKAKELEKLLNNEKTMIIRGAAGKKSTLGGRAKVHDDIYFVKTCGNMLVTHKGIITKVIEQEKMTQEESSALIKKYESELSLTEKQYKRWVSKKCLGLFEISEIKAIEPFKYNRLKSMDDWIITDDITSLKAE